jgi:hypothetical protein
MGLGVSEGLVVEKLGENLFQGLFFFSERYAHLASAPPEHLARIVQRLD